MEPAPCGDQDDRDALLEVQPDGEGQGPGRAARDDGLVGTLVVISAAAMDRRLAPDSGAMLLRGRSHTQSGSLLKDSIPIRT